MKVFVSSVIADYQQFRDAAASAISTLGHEPLLAEDFPASPDSPQSACLAGVRESGAVVLLLSERYGYQQGSGLSATHEEYREARDSRPVLVFIEAGMMPDTRQTDFISEVQSWEKGHYTASFTDAQDLRDKVTRALHDFTLTAESSPLDETELVARARELIPSRQQMGNATLIVSVAPGPTRPVLRPAELEADALANHLVAEALTGPYAVLSTADGTERLLRGDALELTQRQSGRLVHLDESGRVAVAQPALADHRGRTGIPSLIEEEVRAAIDRALRFTARILDHVDPANRLSHVALVVALLGAGYLPWRTQAEQQESPGRASIGAGTSGDITVTLAPPTRRRPALTHDAGGLSEDFAVRLRRGVRG